MVRAIDRCQLEDIQTLADDVYTRLIGVKGSQFVDRAASRFCIAAIPVLADAGARIDLPETMQGGMVYKTWFNAGNAVGRRSISSDDKHALWAMLLKTYGFPTYWVFKKSMTLNVVSLMTAECVHGQTLDDDLVATLQLMVRYSSPEIVLSMASEPANPSGENPIDYAAKFRCSKTLAYFKSLEGRGSEKESSGILDGRTPE
jgi:hypothetical protein